jgi:hypothetical protein
VRSPFLLVQRIGPGSCQRDPCISRIVTHTVKYLYNNRFVPAQLCAPCDKHEHCTKCLVPFRGLKLGIGKVQGRQSGAVSPIFSLLLTRSRLQPASSWVRPTPTCSSLLTTTVALALGGCGPELIAEREHISLIRETQGTVLMQPSWPRHQSHIAKTM